MAAIISGEWPVDVVRALRLQEFLFHVAYTVENIPTRYGYTNPEPAAGAAKLTVWRYSQTGVTVDLDNVSATVSGDWESGPMLATYDWTPTVAGTYYGVMAFQTPDYPAQYGLGEGPLFFIDYEVLVYDDTAGHPAEGSGKIISLFSYDRPEAVYLMYETLNGDLVAKRDPA